VLVRRKVVRSKVVTLGAKAILTRLEIGHPSLIYVLSDRWASVVTLGTVTSAALPVQTKYIAELENLGYLERIGSFTYQLA
jgi:hypothetical protein